MEPKPELLRFFTTPIPTVDLTAAFIRSETNGGGQRQEGQRDDTPVYPQYSESVLFVSSIIGS